MKTRTWGRASALPSSGALGGGDWFSYRSTASAIPSLPLTAFTGTALLGIVFMMPRRQRRLAVIAVVLAVVAGHSREAFGQAQQRDTPKPVIVGRPVHGVWGGPEPTSWDEMVEKSGMVAHVRILSKTYVTGPGEVAFTKYDAEVIELLKRDGSAAVQPTAVTLFHLGGYIERANVRIRMAAEDQPDWRIGGEHLMFLAWNPVLSGWTQAFSTTATFEVLGDPGQQRLRPLPSHNQFVRSKTDHPVGPTKQQIREAVGRAARKR